MVRLHVGDWGTPSTNTRPPWSWCKYLVNGVVSSLGGTNGMNRQNDRTQRTCQHRTNGDYFTINEVSGQWAGIPVLVSTMKRMVDLMSSYSREEAYVWYYSTIWAQRGTLQPINQDLINISMKKLLGKNKLPMNNYTAVQLYKSVVRGPWGSDGRNKNRTGMTVLLGFINPTRTRTNTNPNDTEANAAGRSVRACDARKSKS